ncbi:hypothetical protein PM082_018541 [Marasmius tenuissimus]|nr:hypothetical protein PM082_018541 [Marasmius tenuissimus]
MTTHFFQGAVAPRVGRNSVFQNVEGNVNNNYLSCTSCRERDEDQIMPRQSLFREFFMGDVFLRERTCSQELEVVIRKPSPDPLGAGAETRVKVIKKYHTATIYPDSGQALTVITLEPEDKGDREATRLLWKAVIEGYSTYREPQLTQLLGLMKSSIPAFILHQELVNVGFMYQYLGLDIDSNTDSDADPVHHRQLHNKFIVFSYLLHTREVALRALRADTTLTIPISYDFEDWNFNLTTRTWHYDITSASIKPLEGMTMEMNDSDDEVYFSTSTPLPPGTTPPRLDADDIITCFEKTFGDALYLYATFGLTMDKYLLSFQQHGFLTLGAVVDGCEVGISAHFPSTPAPERFLQDRSLGINASYSTKDFVDEIDFAITGEFSHSFTSAYLFVPPLCVEVINGMHCVSYPLPDQLFLWTTDPAGKDVIPEETYEKFGIPKLGVQGRVGSSWMTQVHVTVGEYMRRKGYETADSRRYAQDHGYPELLLGDPHDQRMEGLQDSDTNQPTLGLGLSGSHDGSNDRANGT